MLLNIWQGQMNRVNTARLVERFEKLAGDRFTASMYIEAQRLKGELNGGRILLLSEEDVRLLQRAMRPVEGEPER